jgi:peroxiredoxin
MRCFWQLSMLVVLTAGLAAPALAYNAETGNRAVDIGGWDIVHHRQVRLNDFSGKWVLLEFSAMWCGPCNRDRPRFLKLVKPYLERRELVVMLVSCDTPETLHALKRMIRSNNIGFPVLYDGGDLWTTPVLDWCHGENLGFGIPEIVLINPQGVVVSNGLDAGNFASTLEFFISEPRPVIALRSRHWDNGDGSFSFCAEVVNPAHEQLKLVMDLSWLTAEFRPDDPLRTMTGSSWNVKYYDQEMVMQFDDLGEGACTFVVWPAPEQDVLGYKFYLTFPGSADVPGWKGHGIQLTSGCTEAVFPGLEQAGDGFRVLPD